MFEQDSSSRPFEKRRSGAGGIAYTALAEELERDRQARRTLLRAIAIAALVHAALFFLSFPERQPVSLSASGRQQKVYVVQPVRFRPPPPQQAAPPIPKRQARKVPIPDPTPDDPEPLRVDEEVDLPPVDAVITDQAFFGAFDIPPGPPGPTSVLQVTGDVAAPVKIFAPQPIYTEEAREARIQGVVIVQAVIDVDGSVASVKVLKGLPFGLTEKTVETVASWRFEPATLEGTPVPVYYNLTVSFSLQ